LLIMKEKIYIIGAGLAGLSAAYALLKKGYTDIAIFEASPFAGGRCRSFYDDALHTDIDNGNHLIMQANKNVIRLIEELGAEDRFNNFKGDFRFFNSKNGERYAFKAPFPDIKRYGVKAVLAMVLFILFPKRTTVFQVFGKYNKLYQEIINPVSRSILNTPSEVASSGILRKVLRKLAFTRKGFNYHYPKKNWNDALIEPLVQELERLGVKINYGKRLKELVKGKNNITALEFEEERISTEEGIVVLTVPSHEAASLADIPTPDIFYPIINIHFKLDHGLKPQIYGVVGGNIEWVFVKPEVLATTYSAAEESFDKDKMVAEAWRICCNVLGMNAEMPPYRVIVERRAGFACVDKNIAMRPRKETAYSNLFLAGDFVESDIPATIEAAVSSGFRVGALAV